MNQELAEAFGCSKRNPILFFEWPYRYLSNFWPCKLVYDGVEYNSSEHAYMAQKTLDLGLRDQIRMASTSGRAKRIGRKLQLRDDWEEVKIQIMYEVVYAKFSQNPELKKLLLETGNRYLEEGNTWNDTFWGTVKGQGKNCLGQILMLVRRQLRGELS